MDYSQNGEQDIILNHFKNFKGSLLDIGANDGQTLSNSRALMELGWHGVLVEPSKRAFEKLRVAYSNNKKARLVSFGISDKSGIVKFFESGEHLKKGDVSLLSTCKESELARWEGSENEFTETEIECITYAQLLSLCDCEFDFITIDAEGLDFEILSQIDLSRVKMLIIETNSTEDHKYIDYCESFGMKLLHKNFENLIFSR